MNEASRDQLRAARPDHSTWLSANAGSGKTRVLTDRVARLLLDGVRPERILCLTYTKAAAMEMQNRLFQTLGAWAMLEDDALHAALATVGVAQDSLSAATLSQARTLFAGAIEAPGGLKIQTIHSFCSSVLRRFPLEAGVSPGFTEIDERVQARLIADVLDQMADDPAARDGIDAVVPYLNDEEGIVSLAKSVAGSVEAFSPPATWTEICAWLGIDPSLDEATIIDSVILGGERALADVVSAQLDTSKANHASVHRRLSAIPWEEMTLDALEPLEAVCLTGEGAREPFTAKLTGFISKAVEAKIGDALPAFHDLMRRVEAARALRLGLLNARKINALHRFARAFLPAYADAKTARGYLDFDDLINRMRSLLSEEGVAQWVLFRLDGGIDHILVDEAQDTSPSQWTIVNRLAEDFASGEGARANTRRTIFVVGDKKQSIYSFQGADPEGFDRMAAHFGEKLHAIGQELHQADLVWSFRTSPVILDIVDRVCAAEAAQGVGAGITHKAFFDARPGRVDLWPIVPPAESDPEPDWHDPVMLVREEHHTAVLAQTLALRIADMLREGAEIDVPKEGLRAVGPGDILILVQRRSDLFRKIIAALKALNLPVAGVDRAQLTSPISVQDLIALMKFLATPEDDLSLAALLRSPLCGWSEGQLFDLAHGRKGYLWRALQTRREMDPDTVAMLEDLRDQADFLRPYDILERALTRHDGRRKLIARLGPEAEDAIDAMLEQALSYEIIEVPSLAGFVGWLETDTVTVKRDMSKPRGMIRVMTVHGAKGLEAPVVILPDCGPTKSHSNSGVLRPDNGPALWPSSRASASAPMLEALEAKKARDEAERHRLLYVAMTRAESWLIVAAAGKISDEPRASWYRMVEAAMQDAGAAPLHVPDIEGMGLRVQHGAFTPLGPRSDAAAGARAVLPDWIDTPAPAEPRDIQARSPSALGGAKALMGEGADGTATSQSDADTLALGEAAALQHGRLVHLMLEHLPRLPAPAWVAAAPGIGALEAPELSDARVHAAFEEARAVLSEPSLAPLFDAASQALAEVEVTGESVVLGVPIFGVIDRLIVTPERVLAVDFKSNQTVPTRPEDTPEGLLRQMGAYAEVLAAIYPDRPVETAILWTRRAELMRLPYDLVNAALVRAAAP